jgi:hypothetical protein
MASALHDQAWKPEGFRCAREMALLKDDPEGDFHPAFRLL